MAIELEWAPARALRLHDPSLDIPQPDVPEHLIWIWRAFHRLDQDRGWIGGGMAMPLPCRISWRQITDWSDHHGYDAEDHAMLDACMTEMDTVYLADHARRRK